MVIFYPYGKVDVYRFFLREMTGILTYNLDLLPKMTLKYSPLNGNALMVIYVIFIPRHPNPLKKTPNKQIQVICLVVSTHLKNAVLMKLDEIGSFPQGSG